MLLYQLRNLGIDRIILQAVEIFNRRGHSRGVSHAWRFFTTTELRGPIDIEVALALALGGEQRTPLIVGDMTTLVPECNLGKFILVRSYLESMVGDLLTWSDSTETEEIVRILRICARRIQVACGPNQILPRYVGRPTVTLQPSDFDVDVTEQLRVALEGF